MTMSVYTFSISSLWRKLHPPTLSYVYYDRAHLSVFGSFLHSLLQVRKYSNEQDALITFNIVKVKWQKFCQRDANARIDDFSLPSITTGGFDTKGSAMNSCHDKLICYAAKETCSGTMVVISLGGDWIVSRSRLRSLLHSIAHSIDTAVNAIAYAASVKSTIGAIVRTRAFTVGS